MQCGSCQAELAADARFCHSCGAGVAAPSPGKDDSLRGSLERALGAQYEIVRLLGRGGMGAVYLARETALDRLVAVKVLPPEKGDASGWRERFRREARTAAKLTHPNIVPLHRFGEAEGTMYFVMGYVRGEPLATRLRREGRLPPEEVRRILAEVADALDYAHRQGVVHRDVKPDNILIDDESGRPLLTDFGIAKAAGSGQTLTELGAVVGTPSFMSPEQVSGKPLDGRSDIYSLGVMGYLMASGRLPFEGDARDILLQHLTKEPPPLAHLAGEVPADLASAIHRCLAKEPGSRWPDAKSLREALGATLTGREELPEALERVEGWGFWLLAAAVAIGYVTLLTSLVAGRPGPFLTSWRGGAAPTLWEALVLILQAGVLLYWLVPLERARVARSEGIAWSEILRVAFWPPGWWLPWYPRALRRPGDVWERLPPWVRVHRTVGFSWGVTLAAYITAFILWSVGSGVMRGVPVWARPIQVGVNWLFLLLAVAILLSRPLGLVLWARPRGLRVSDFARLFSEPTVKSRFWTQPGIAAVLLPESAAKARRSTTEPRSPQEFLQAIARAAQELTGPPREVSGTAVDGARALATAIASLDEQLAQLQRRIDSDEMERLERRLAALDDQGTEAPEDREIRELVMKQLDLSRRLVTRVQDVASQRDRLLDLLRCLWGEVRGLRLSAPQAALDFSQHSARIRALCGEIDRHTRAAGTAAADTGSAGIEDLPTLQRRKD